METIIKENLETDNWFTYKKLYADFARLAIKRGYTDIVEIGSWKGHSITFLAKRLKDTAINISVVDLFENTYQYDEYENIQKYRHKIFHIFMENLIANNLEERINIFRGYSWDMADNFKDKSLDIIFIDADHSYEAVMKDLNAWYPKLREGGIIAGHDVFSHQGVNNALFDFFSKDVDIQTDFHQNIWFIDTYGKK